MVYKLIECADTTQLDCGSQRELLRLILDECFENAAYFSFQHARWRNCKNHRLERRLEPFLLQTIETEKWFGYDYSQAPPGDAYSMKINLYRADETAKKHLLRWMDSIFMETIKNERLCPSTQTLEDLCVFSRAGIIMGTVSHEHILAIEPHSEALSQMVNFEGAWKVGAWDTYSGMPIDMRVFL